MNNLIQEIQKKILEKNFTDAESMAWTLYEQNSKDFFNLKTLGLVLLLQEKRYGSIDFYQRALQIKNDDFDVLCNLGHLNLQIEEFGIASDYALRAINNPSSNFLPYSQMAEILMKRRDYLGSLKYCEIVLKMATMDTLKSNIGFVHIYIDVLIALGKKEQAIKFINFFQEKSFNDEIFQHHAGMGPETIEKKQIEKVEKLVKENKHDNHIIRARYLCAYLFGLAKYYGYKKENAHSEKLYIKANNEILKIQRYFPLKHQGQISKIKKIFRDGFNKSQKIDTNKGEGLIFIVGMPRSGTTLLESIIGSNDNVISGGELISMHQLSGYYYLDEQEDAMLERHGNRDIGDIYLNRISFIKGDKKFFIDKLPGNYHNIGFISEFLPAAKIIYMKRNVWDIATSIYKQFYVNNIPFAASFFNIAINIANQEELIRFWGDEMNYNFITVNYEELVSDTENIANNIFKYCGLDGSYNEDTRKNFFSRTASKSQISKNINTSSISKREFEDFKSGFEKDIENQRKYWQIDH